MKRFRFSLSAIRELREAEERTAQKAFGDAVRACDEAVMRLTMVDRELQKSWEGIRTGSLQGTRAEHLRHARAWCVALEEKQKQLARAVAECQRAVDAAHQVLQHATRRREALDRIFRKQRSAHERTLLIEQQNFLDEIAARGAWDKTTHLEVT